MAGALGGGSSVLFGFGARRLHEPREKFKVLRLELPTLLFALKKRRHQQNQDSELDGSAAK